MRYLVIPGLGVHLLAVHRVDTDRPFDITWSEIRRLLEMVLLEVEPSDEHESGGAYISLLEAIQSGRLFTSESLIACPNGES